MHKPSLRKKSSIYALLDPISFDVKYVGASVNAKRRLGSICSGYHCGKDLRDWVFKLKASGHKPKMVILESDVPNEIRGDREKHWMDHYISIGASLLNYDGIHRSWDPK